MAPLTKGLELLEAAVGYGLTGAGLVTPQLLARPTPCRGWDLGMLLRHASESIETLNAAIATEHVDVRYAQGDGGPDGDAVSALRLQAATLLETCSAAGADDGIVAIGDRELARSKIAVAGAIELTIHGWDIRTACGALGPVPPLLACLLLPVAQLLVTPGVRPGLFADPVQLTGPACPGDQLVAFLGRQPRWTAAPGTA